MADKTRPTKIQITANSREIIVDGVISPYLQSTFNQPNKQASI